MNITLNIGFVCTAISPYYAEEYKIKEPSKAKNIRTEGKNSCKL